MTCPKTMPARHLLAGLVLLLNLTTTHGSRAAGSPAGAQTFAAIGVVMELPSDRRTVVIRHEAISNYMAAMTMPFPVKEPAALSGLRAGDKVSFQLHVTDDESWVDNFIRRGTAQLPPPTKKVPVEPPPARPLLHFKFTNELGQAVSLAEFPGQALAITFFYTRCPLPEYCPRLSKNFQEASQKLESMTNAPSNWHFLSISFDPEFDTPAMLKAYGQSYQYDPQHWSFLTGPDAQIHALAKACGVTTSADGATINHNFRTLIIDAAGRLQTVFPTTGDLSDQIVDQIIRAAGVTKLAAAAPPKP